MNRAASPSSDDGSFGNRLMMSDARVRAGWIGAVYDIAVTAVFATPWTAAFVLGVLADVHDAAGLPGEDMPVFDTSHLLFVTLFGVVVTMWGVVRVLRPTPFLISVDTVGRAAFAVWFIWALLEGHSAVIVVFLVLELGFLVAQARGVRDALRSGQGAARSGREATVERPLVDSG